MSDLVTLIIMILILKWFKIIFIYLLKIFKKQTNKQIGGFFFPYLFMWLNDNNP
jgi:hypothetical protein